MPLTRDGASGLLDLPLQQQDESKGTAPATPMHSRMRSRSTSPMPGERLFDLPPPQSRSRPGSPTAPAEGKKALRVQVEPGSTSHIVYSPTAVPIHFRRPKPSPGAPRPSSSAGPSMPADVAESPTWKLGGGNKRPRSTEFKTSREFRPLWLVERHSPAKLDRQPDEPYPSLPSSKTTSRTSSVGDLSGYGLAEGFSREVPHNYQDHAQRPAAEQPNLGRTLSLELDIDPSLYDPDLLGSQQTTPTAESFHVAAQKSKKEKPKPEFHSPSELLLDPFSSQIQLPESPALKPFSSSEGSMRGENTVVPVDWYMNLKELPPLPRSLAASPDLSESLPPLPESRPSTSHSEIEPQFFTPSAEFDESLPLLPESRPSTSHTDNGAQLTGGLITGVGASFVAGVAAQLADWASKEGRRSEEDVKPATPFLDATVIDQEIVAIPETTSAEPTREAPFIFETTPKAFEDVRPRGPAVEGEQGPRSQEEIEPAVSIVDLSTTALDEVPAEPVTQLIEPSTLVESTPREPPKVEGDDFQPTSSKKSKKAKKAKKKGKNAAAPDESEIKPSEEKPSNSEHDSISRSIDGDDANVRLTSESKVSEEKQEPVPVESPLEEPRFLEPTGLQPTVGFPAQEELSHQAPAETVDPDLEFSIPKKKSKKGKGKQKQRAGKLAPQEDTQPVMNEPVLELNRPPSRAEKSKHITSLLGQEDETPIQESTKEFYAADIPLPEDKDSELWEPTTDEYIPNLSQSSQPEKPEDITNLSDKKVEEPTLQPTEEFDPTTIALPEDGDTELEELANDEYVPGSIPPRQRETLEDFASVLEKEVRESTTELDPTTIALPEDGDSELENPANDECAPGSSPPGQRETLEDFTSVLEKKAQEPTPQPAREPEPGTIPRLENSNDSAELLKEGFPQPADQQLAISADESPFADVVPETKGDGSLAPEKLKTVLPELPVGNVPPTELPVDNSGEYSWQPNKKKGKKGKKGRKSITKDEPAETGTISALENPEAFARKEPILESQLSTTDCLVQNKNEHEFELQAVEDVDTATLLDKEANKHADTIPANEVSPHLIGGVDAQIDTSTKALKKQKRKDKKKQKSSLESEEQPIQSGSSKDIVDEGRTEDQPELEQLTPEQDNMQQPKPSGLSDDPSKGQQLLEDSQPPSQLEPLKELSQGSPASLLAEKEPTAQDPVLEISEDLPADTVTAENISGPPTSNYERASEELKNEGPPQNDTPTIDTQKAKKGKKGKKKRQSVTWEDEIPCAESSQSQPDSSQTNDADEPSVEMEASPSALADNLETEGPKTSKAKRKAKKDRKQQQYVDWTADEPSAPSEEQLHVQVEPMAGSPSEPSEPSKEFELDTSAEPSSPVPAKEEKAETPMVESSQDQSIAIEKDSEMFSIPGSWADDDDQVLDPLNKGNETAPREVPPSNDDGNEFQISKNKKKNKKNKKTSRLSDWTDENTSSQIEKKEISESTLPESLQPPYQPPPIHTEPREEESMISGPESFQDVAESPAGQILPEAQNSREPIKTADQEHFVSLDEAPMTPEIPEAITQELVTQTTKVVMTRDTSQHSDTDGQKLLDMEDVPHTDAPLPSVDNHGLFSITEEMQKSPTELPHPPAAETGDVIQADAREAAPTNEEEEPLTSVPAGDTLISEAPVSETVTRIEEHILPPSVEATSLFSPQLALQSLTPNELGDQIANSADKDLNFALEQENILASSKDEISNDMPTAGEPTVAQDEEEGKEEPLPKYEEQSRPSGGEDQNVTNIDAMNVPVSEEITPPSLPESVGVNVDVEPIVQPEAESNFQSEPDRWNVTSSKKGKKKKNNKNRDTQDYSPPAPDELSTEPTPVATTSESTRELTAKNFDEETGGWDVPTTKKGKKKHKSRVLEDTSFPTNRPPPTEIPDAPESSTILEPQDAKEEESRDSWDVTSSKKGRKKNKQKGPVVNEETVSPSERRADSLAQATDDPEDSEPKETQLVQQEADSWDTWDTTSAKKGKKKNKKNPTFEEDAANPAEPYVDDLAKAMDDSKTSELKETQVEQQEAGSWSSWETTSTKKDNKENTKKQAIQNDSPLSDELAPLSIPEPQTEQVGQGWSAMATKKGKKKNKKGQDIQQESPLALESVPPPPPESIERVISEVPSRSTSKKEKKAKKKAKEAAPWSLNDAEEGKTTKAVQNLDEASPSIEADLALAESEPIETEPQVEIRTTETQIAEAAAPDMDRKTLPEPEEIAECPNIEKRVDIADETKQVQYGVEDVPLVEEPLKPELTPQEVEGDNVGEKEKSGVWEKPSKKKKSKKEKNHKKDTKGEVDIEAVVEKKVDDGEEKIGLNAVEESAPLKRYLSKKDKKNKEGLRQFDEEESTEQLEQAPMPESSATAIHTTEDNELTEEPQEKAPTGPSQETGSTVEPQNEDDDYWPPIDWGRDKAWKADEPQPPPRSRDPDTSSLDLLLSGDEPQPREDPFRQQPADARGLVGDSIGDFDEDASLVAQSPREKWIPDAAWVSTSRQMPVESEQVRERRAESAHSDELPPISLDDDAPETLQDDIDIAGFLQKQDPTEELPSLSSVPQSSDTARVLKENPKIYSTEMQGTTQPSAEPSVATETDNFWATSGSKQKKKKGKGKKKTALGVSNDADENVNPIEKPQDSFVIIKKHADSNVIKTQPETSVERSATAAKSEASEPPTESVNTRKKDDEDDFWGFSEKKEKKNKGRKKGRKDRQDTLLDESQPPHQTPAKVQEKPALEGFSPSGGLEEPVHSQPSGVVASVFPFLERVSRRRPSQEADSHETPAQETTSQFAKEMWTPFIGKQSISTKEDTFPHFSEPTVDTEALYRFEDPVKRRSSLNPIPEVPAAGESTDRSIDVSDKHSEPELPAIKDTRKREPPSVDLASKKTAPTFSHSPSSTRVDVEHSSPVSRKPPQGKLQKSPTIHDHSISVLSDANLQQQKNIGSDSQIHSSEQPRSIFGGPYGLGGDQDILISPPRTPLATIKEHVPINSPRNARNRDLSEVGSRGQGVKAARHAGSPQLAIGPEHILPPPASRLSYSGSDTAENPPPPQPPTLDIPKKRRVERSPTSENRRSASNPYADEPRTPEHKEHKETTRSVSAGGSPGLRRVHSARSTDLRAASKQAQTSARDPDLDVEGIPSSSSYDPVTDKGKRPVRGMEDVYVGHSVCSSYFSITFVLPSLQVN